MRPILLTPDSVNHIAPSGPATISPGALGPLGSKGSANSVMRPVVVMRPILLASVSANHSAPSGPSAIPEGPLPVGPNASRD